MFANANPVRCQVVYDLESPRPLKSPGYNTKRIQRTYNAETIMRLSYSGGIFESNEGASSRVTHAQRGERALVVGPKEAVARLGRPRGRWRAELSILRRPRREDCPIGEGLGLRGV